MEENLNTNWTLRSCRKNSRSATCVCNTCVIHFWGALFVPNTCIKTASAPTFLALRRFTERPERNSSHLLLWSVQFKILMIWLARKMFNLAVFCLLYFYFFGIFFFYRTTWTQTQRMSNRFSSISLYIYYSICRCGYLDHISSDNFPFIK
jgi:hypothetical protein